MVFCHTFISCQINYMNKLINFRKYEDQDNNLLYYRSKNKFSTTKERHEFIYQSLKNKTFSLQELTKRFEGVFTKYTIKTIFHNYKTFYGDNCKLQ